MAMMLKKQKPKLSTVLETGTCGYGLRGLERPRRRLAGGAENLGYRSLQHYALPSALG